jgi:RHS repeat-associated protein
VSAYDELGRVTGTWSAPAGADLSSTIEERIPANQLTARAYDTLVAGQPTSSTRYVGGSGASGKAYTTKVTAYDTLDRPTATELDLPGDDPLVTSGAVTSALTFTTAYNIDGTQQFVRTPAAGGLPAETVQTDYDDVGLPRTVEGSSDYVQGTGYSPLGQLSTMDLATSDAAGVKHMFVANIYEDGTDRLQQSKVTDQTHPYELQEPNYGYDDAGNVTHIFDPTTSGGTAAADNQCFTYDGHDRLTEAWTPATADCSTAKRTTAALGGPGPYWTSYAYTAGGLRSTQTDHTAAGSTSATYCYNGTHPHALTAVIPALTCTGAPTQYTYDKAGNTQTRPQGTTTESLTWNAEGRLDTASVPGGSTTDTTNYLYDATGNLLVRRDTSGETVLYLDGVTEVHLKKGTTGSTFWAQRTYGLGGTSVALRTDKPGQPTLTWLTGDLHGTSTLAIDNNGQTVTKRYTTPFGATRGGGTSTWPDDKGFLGKPKDDTTGLTYVGARAYDPAIGRFVSVDPLFDPGDSQSLNGYTYADNNPVTRSDPNGTQILGPTGDPFGDAGWRSTHGAGTDGTNNESGNGSQAETRNGGKTNVPQKCAGKVMPSAHDAAVCATGYAAEDWAKGLGVKGYTTVDINEGDRSSNYIYGSSPTGKTNNGWADVIFWGDDTVFVWEVKPNSVAGDKSYGREKGPKDLDRYIRALRRYLASIGDDRDVEAGPMVANSGFTSGQGTGRVWSERDWPGMRFYGTDNKRTRAPKSVPQSPGSTPEATQSPTPGVNSVPSPTPLPQPVPPSAGSIKGFGLAATVVVILGVAARLASQGPSCVVGGNC